MPAKLGIYFGIKGLDIIQTKGKKFLTAIHIPKERFSVGEFEEKVPQDVKIVALLNDEFRRQKIEAKEAGIAVSGRDLIIRSFELPSSLTRDELQSAINFEVRKYLPFKTEDLISDFRLKFYKRDKRNIILFFGIKKETMENYLSIMKQLGLKVTALEYSAFSILRLIKLTKFNIKGTFAFVEIDLEDETNFMIIDDGFPLFSRDIDLSSIVESNLELLLERIKSEIQLSLDYYYHRKFPSKSIDKIIFFAPQDYKSLLSKFSQDLELPAEFFDIPKHINKGRKFNLREVKAYGISLVGLTKIPVSLNLASTWDKGRKITSPVEGIKGISVADLKPDNSVLGLSLLVIIFLFIQGLYPRFPLSKHLARVVKFRPRILTVSGNKSYEELINIKTEYDNKVANIEKLLKSYPHVSLNLAMLPQLLPRGVWLKLLTFRQDDTGRELLLNGSAYLKNRNKELETVNLFFSNIKNNPEFIKNFSDIALVSIDRTKVGKGEEVTDFAISCRY